MYGMEAIYIRIYMYGPMYPSRCAAVSMHSCTCNRARSNEVGSRGMESDQMLCTRAARTDIPKYALHPVHTPQIVHTIFIPQSPEEGVYVIISQIEHRLYSNYDVLR